MRRWQALLASSVLASWVLLGCGSPTPRPAPAPPPPPDPHVRTFYLDNGLRVSLYRDPRTPVVYVHSRYAIGTSDDPIDQPGLASVVAALMYEGRGSTATTSFAARLAPITLLDQGTIDHDSIDWYSSALPSRLDELLEIEAERLALGCDTIDRSTLDRAVQRAGTQAVDDEAAFRRVIARAVYGDKHPYARRTLPSAAAPLALDRTCAFVVARLGADVGALIVSGNIDLDETERTVHRLFAKARTATARQSTPPDPLPPGRVEITASVERALVVISANGRFSEETSRALEGATPGPRRPALVDFGSTGARAVALVIPVDDREGVEAAVSRGTALLVAAAKRVADPARTGGSGLDGIVVDGAAMALFALDREPSWRPGDRLASDDSFPVERFEASRMHVTVVRPAGEREIQMPPPRARSGRGAYDPSLVHPDVEAPIELPREPIARIEKRTLANGVRIVEARSPGAPTMGVKLALSLAPGVEIRDSSLEIVGDVARAPTHVADLWSALDETIADAERSSPPVSRAPYTPRSCPDASSALDPFWYVYKTLASPRTVDPRRGHYRPDHSSLVFVGDYQPEAVDQAIDTTFATWPAPTDPPPEIMLPAASVSPRWRGIADDRAMSASIAIGFGRASHEAHGLAGRMLVGGLVLGVGGGQFDLGIMLARDFAPADLVTGVGAISRELDTVRTNPAALGPLLAAVRRRSVEQILGSFEGSWWGLQRLALVAEHDLPEDFYDGIARALVSMTPDEIAAAAKHDLDPDRMTVAVYGPRKEVEAALIAMGAKASEIDWKDYSACP